MNTAHLAAATLACMIGLLPVVKAGPSHAEWRYCLAVSPERGEVILSEPVLTQAPLTALERDFDRWLSSQGIPHEAAACPTAATPGAVEALREYAARYNGRLGLTPHFVQWSDL
jgi:hypothetical protein